ncbi:hypothetical protein [Jeotgalibacillus campisalis]|uniref:Uncharacterized protein n=1 Tax=Jeotgalibacillus campisalis TaxID=220754 RepID=A0A0C2R7E5_9BACL|nr:hypothetical protein [Jeotgalibacillus campisalis]KIL46175.1 hypothetical protein KR50_28500 [Jeotgalibacillus campisalis]
MNEKELEAKGTPYIIVCGDGKRKVVPLKPYSRTTVIMNQNKVDRVLSEESEKF